METKQVEETNMNVNDVFESLRYGRLRLIGLSEVFKREMWTKPERLETAMKNVVRCVRERAQSYGDYYDMDKQDVDRFEMLSGTFIKRMKDPDPVFALIYGLALKRCATDLDGIEAKIEDCGVRIKKLAEYIGEYSEGKAGCNYSFEQSNKIANLIPKLVEEIDGMGNGIADRLSIESSLRRKEDVEYARKRVKSICDDFFSHHNYTFIVDPEEFERMKDKGYRMDVYGNVDRVADRFESLFLRVKPLLPTEMVDQIRDTDKEKVPTPSAREIYAATHQPVMTASEMDRVHNKIAVASKKKEEMEKELKELDSFLASREMSKKNRHINECRRRNLIAGITCNNLTLDRLTGKIGGIVKNAPNEQEIEAELKKRNCEALRGQLGALTKDLELIREFFVIKRIIIEGKLKEAEDCLKAKGLAPIEVPECTKMKDLLHMHSSWLKLKMTTRIAGIAIHRMTGGRLLRCRHCGEVVRF